MKNLGTPEVLEELQTRLRLVQTTGQPLWGSMSALHLRQFGR